MPGAPSHETRLFSRLDPARPVDVLCLGHPLIDRLAHAQLSDVIAAAMEPGAMTLVDGARAAEIDRVMPSWEQVAGGSAANTAAGMASLGGKPAFAGAIGADEAGAWYSADLAKAGVRCTLDSIETGEPTGVCHIFITPGGQRSMATSLAAAAKMRRATVERAGVGEAAMVYIEGYLLDAPDASEALEAAVELGRRHGTLVALTMSDPFVVSRHRERIIALIEDGAVDLVLGNEEEAMGLSDADDLESALGWFDVLHQVAVVTRGPAGALVTDDGARVEIAAYPVERVEDTTGAGDQFAAGCLYGITHGLSWPRSLALGAFAASEVISHVGARPEVVLREVAPVEVLEAPA